MSGSGLKLMDSFKPVVIVDINDKVQGFPFFSLALVIVHRRIKSHPMKFGSC